MAEVRTKKGSYVLTGSKVGGLKNEGKLKIRMAGEHKN